MADQAPPHDVAGMRAPALRAIALAAAIAVVSLVACADRADPDKAGPPAASAPHQADLFAAGGQAPARDPAPLMDASAIASLEIQRIEKLEGPSAPGQEVLVDGDTRYRVVAPWIEVPQPSADGTRAAHDRVLERLRMALSTPSYYPQGVSSDCFDPGFAVRVGAGASQRTYLVCLKCDKVVRPGTPADGEWTPNEDGMDLLKACYVDVFLLDQR